MWSDKVSEERDGMATIMVLPQDIEKAANQK